MQHQRSAIICQQIDVGFQTAIIVPEHEVIGIDDELTIGHYGFLWGEMDTRTTFCHFYLSTQLESFFIISIGESNLGFNTML